MEFNNQKTNNMKATELKKLASQFSEFVYQFENYEGMMSEFWFATFRCNNSAREAELLEYWRNHQKKQ